MSTTYVDCPTCGGEKVFEVECWQQTWDEPGGCEVGLDEEASCPCPLTDDQWAKLEEVAVEKYCEPLDP